MRAWQAFKELQAVAGCLENLVFIRRCSEVLRIRAEQNVQNRQILSEWGALRLITRLLKVTDIMNDNILAINLLKIFNIVLFRDSKQKNQIFSLDLKRVDVKEIIKLLNSLVLVHIRDKSIIELICRLVMRLSIMDSEIYRHLKNIIQDSLVIILPYHLKGGDAFLVKRICQCIVRLNTFFSHSLFSYSIKYCAHILLRDEWFSSKQRFCEAGLRLYVYLLQSPMKFTEGQLRAVGNRIISILHHEPLRSHRGALLNCCNVITVTILRHPPSRGQYIEAGIFDVLLNLSRRGRYKRKRQVLRKIYACLLHLLHVTHALISFLLQSKMIDGFGKVLLPSTAFMKAKWKPFWNEELRKIRGIRRGAFGNFLNHLHSWKSMVKLKSRASANSPVVDGTLIMSPRSALALSVFRNLRFCRAIASFI